VNQLRNPTRMPARKEIGGTPETIEADLSEKSTPRAQPALGVTPLVSVYRRRSGFGFVDCGLLDLHQEFHVRLGALHLLEEKF